MFLKYLNAVKLPWPCSQSEGWLAAAQFGAIRNIPIITQVSASTLSCLYYVS